MEAYPENKIRTAEIEQAKRDQKLADAGGKKPMTICRECVRAITPKFYSTIPNPIPLDWECGASGSIDPVTGRPVHVLCRDKNFGECTDFVMIQPLESFRKSLPWWKRMFFA